MLKGLLFISLLGSAHASSWLPNNPYPTNEDGKNIFYSSFTEQPKTLDPARAYTNNEFQFIAQIYEPPLQYNYFKRPYQLEPLTAKTMPTIRYLNKNHQIIAAGSADIAYSVYTIEIQPGILFQPHPALAKNVKNAEVYSNLTPDYLIKEGISQLSDFAYTGTREVVADDYIYQIKRLASPNVSSPIYGLMSDHILGFKEFKQLLPAKGVGQFIDLRVYPLEGVKKITAYSYEITLIGQYPQFIFWLAMPFFAPLPWEADRFYSAAGMAEKNLSLDWYPLGTGPFMLSENNPNRNMILSKNPNFRQEYFPVNGHSNKDTTQGFLTNVGRTLPMIDSAKYTLEKESIPRWNKFLQGYYDVSSVSSDSYDQAIEVSASGEPELTVSMENKKMRLIATTEASVYYLGFNMLDPIVGGASERARKLRLAISIAVNYDENIAIFYNERGHAAQGPIPAGIFGNKEGAAGINPYIYQWDGKKAQRRSIHEARELMSAAGYGGGRDPDTGRSLILHYDVSVTGTPDDKSKLDWMRKQFAQIGIDLDIRATQYNRFQEKMRDGNAQIFSWGWSADYPDPENFLFLLVSANGKAAHGGENTANYSNAAFDALFDAMKNRQNDAERQRLIDTMLEIVRHDAPWVWGINTENLTIEQSWVSATKPNTISLNFLKYMAIDAKKRQALRDSWNTPIIWPILLLAFFLLVSILPLLLAYRRKEREKARRLRS